MPGKKSALLIIDMINTLEFPEADGLLKFAVPAAKNIAKLKEKFYRRRLPVIYVNDNFDEWLSDWNKVYDKCSAPGMKGAELANLLKPTEKDYFILKPRHSGFYATPLGLLLEDLKIKKLVMTGIAGDICVLFTAHEGHVRGYEVIVPEDCIASNTKAQNQVALKQLVKALNLKTTKHKNLRI
jgi:nicotinamidase-related amidase